ncbi:MAG TPA: nicotinate phosphoribosyltransferase [Terriglobia bacterium]|nr:nicotinate phosphoribosyltransferase [Terriglobia bacterium]
MTIESPSHPALLIDLYELTMAAGYFEHKIESRASFELFVRSLPPERLFLLAGGLESALNYLENLHFTGREIDFLRRERAFRNTPESFFEYLRAFRFTGDVCAFPEGTVAFAEEPLVQITAPIIEAQIVETYLLSVINFETLAASKAARTVAAAEGRGVLEFGTRRAQGPEAGLRAARAAYLGGCIATSNVLAGFLYGVPLAGTSAHSWTQVFTTERESFEALLDSFPESAMLLIDTYSTLQGAELAANLGRKIAGVRIDSGDLLEQSRQVRKVLDGHGLHETKIVASGDLNEFRIADLVAQGAPIDLFGVGTELATSRDVPALNVVYKLVELMEGGRVTYKTKLSEHKAYAPGRKQVFRFSRDGRYHHDLIARVDETYPEAESLLRPVITGGKRTSARLSLDDLRADAMANLAHLPEEYKALQGGAVYPVQKSEALSRLDDEVRERCSAEVNAGTPEVY